MEDKHYIQDFKDKDGLFRKLFEEYACVDCGIIPKYDLTELPNGVDTKIYTKTTEKIEEGRICIECSRIRKLKKLKGLIDRSI